MKNILLIGVGGTGSAAVDMFFQKRNELGNQSGNNITALVFDTDAGDLKKITSAKTVHMTDSASVGKICDRIGKEFLREWFPCDDRSVRSQEMVRGASQWRKKSYLAFLNLMNKPAQRNTFTLALEEMSKDPSAVCEVYVIASLAGGTGSGSFIPIALYAKRYLRRVLGKDPIVNAMIALPDIYADSQSPENRIKVYSNAYAILRELNAINLVSRNYNAGIAEHKRAPIRFKLGDASEPNVGLLFDASDERFWTPEAAPFSQVFLLDKIPAVSSIAAHNIVLANSLYTMLCTEVGTAFESELSNHELLRSQTNGSNAIYAGISSAQIRFPSETILDYLAHKKTVDSCDGEWLTLHRAVEQNIHGREQQAKAMRRRYTMRSSEYAEIVIEEMTRLEEANNDEILSLLERAVYTYDEDGNRLPVGQAAAFVENMVEFVNSKISKDDVIEDDILTAIRRCRKSSESGESGRPDKSEIGNCVKKAMGLLSTFYKNCVDAIKRTSGSTADEILTLEKKKEGIVGKDYSVFENLLKKGRNYIHPVAALYLLCLLRVELEQKKNPGFVEWNDLKLRNVTEIPLEMLNVSNDGGASNEEVSVRGRKKSAYEKMGEDRFRNMVGFSKDNTSGEYASARTDTRADVDVLKNDILGIYESVYLDAQAQILEKVIEAVCKNLDVVIAKYRNFFNRFEKEKEDLVEQTKTARRKDAGTVDSVINVFSSEDDKNTIYRSILEESGPTTDREIMETDNIVGLGVFNTVYKASVAEVSQDGSWNDKDSSAFRSLFGDMVAAYRNSIGRSEAFAKYAAFNAVEAIVATCGNNPTDKDIFEAFKSNFSVAQERARPALRLDPSDCADDMVQPTEVTVFMMSLNTGKYLKKNADKFGLHIPADRNKEIDVIYACAEDFVRKFSGNYNARLSIVTTMPDQVLYCTGEIIDITPLRISKFNELGDEGTYYSYYTKAVKNITTYSTDMWNPHLGNNLHKRGFLPYMNEEKERACDKQVIKALLYAFMKKLITYSKSTLNNVDNYFFKFKGSIIQDGVVRIDAKKTSRLIAWLRNNDELSEEWSRLFDEQIAIDINALPAIVGDSTDEIKLLESRLTASPFMKLLTDKLYRDERLSAKIAKSTGKADAEVSVGPTAFEFAYMVKNSEEQERDCDDAERVLDVLYSTFVRMCEARTNAKANPERFIQVYTQQLGNFYNAVASSSFVNASTDCYAMFNQCALWLNQAGVFGAIPQDSVMDNFGNIRTDARFEIEDTRSNEVKKILDAKKCKRPVEAESEVSAEAVVPEA